MLNFKIVKTKNEWRFVTYTNNGEYHPYYNLENSYTRIKEYNPNAVEEIILGYDFFDLNELDREKHSRDYDIFNVVLY